MKILTDPQADVIIALVLDIEKTRSREQAIIDAERIRAVILQAEQVTLKVER